MILLLDVGNTRIKWAQIQGSDLTPQQALTHRGEEQKEWVDKLFRERFRPARVLVANVAGDAMSQLIKEKSQAVWQVAPEFAASTSVAGGVTNAYSTPSSLGVDRWLAVIAAHEIGAAACVIDAGTAVTVDVVDSRGLHLGGLIIPGVELMMNSLLDRTSDIADKSGRRPSTARTDARAELQIFASDTASAVANGALVSIAAAADRAAAAAVRQCGESTRILLTGGDADRLARAMQTPAEIIPDLVLRGLAVLARASPGETSAYNRRR